MSIQQASNYCNTAIGHARSLVERDDITLMDGGWLSNQFDRQHFDHSSSVNNSLDRFSILIILNCEQVKRPLWCVTTSAATALQCVGGIEMQDNHTSVATRPHIAPAPPAFVATATPAPGFNTPVLPIETLCDLHDAAGQALLDWLVQHAPAHIRAIAHAHGVLGVVILEHAQHQGLVSDAWGGSVLETVSELAGAMAEAKG
jgi:hypothetical protein